MRLLETTDLIELPDSSKRPRKFKEQFNKKKFKIVTFVIICFKKIRNRSDSVQWCCLNFLFVCVVISSYQKTQSDQSFPKASIYMIWTPFSLFSYSELILFQNWQQCQSLNKFKIVLRSFQGGSKYIFKRSEWLTNDQKKLS